MKSRLCYSVAVLGAGMAGAAVAHVLALAGHAVHVFDKSRGPGGRMATRRVEWVDRHGHAATTRFDHGALGFSARSTAFQAFVDRALAAACLAEWKPRLAPRSLPLESGAPLYVPAPDMPALCRQMLQGVPTSMAFAVDGLHHGALGWQVQGGGARHASNFDAVVLALPPAQAAPLLNPHRLDWARHACTARMQPCWTVMGVTDDPAPALGWDLARPPSGPLAWVLRSDARPGRAAVPGQAHWVAHAGPGFSQQHLEEPAAWVQQQMQAALAEYVGQPLDWQHCTVHRWRYALPQAHGTVPATSVWWDATQGLGVCGDYFGDYFGVSGVESAWLSAQSLCKAMQQRPPAALDAFTAARHEAGVVSAHQATRRRVA